MIRPEPLVLGDAEGDGLPETAAGIPVVDAHVHLFPDRVFEAIWSWFDTHAWPVRYRLYSDALLDFLGERGVRAVVGLHYAHKPGMAASLNDYVLGVARRRPEVVPTATVFPGEAGDREILRRALGEGARGVKIHCHVQKVAPDAPELEVVWEEAVRAGVPAVVHAGREPSSDAYGIDTRALCEAAMVARVLERHPGLRLVVPHLGSDEFGEYEAMLDRYPNLWLDTTMAIAGYFPGGPGLDVLERRADRLLYGTDFPNLPYAWDRELRRIAGQGLAPERLAAILSDNARRLFRIAAL